MAKTLIAQPMYLAPKDAPVIAVLEDERTAIVHHDNGKWRYGSAPDHVFEPAYVKGFIKPMNASAWTFSRTDD